MNAQCESAFVSIPAMQQTQTNTNEETQMKIRATVYRESSDYVRPAFFPLTWKYMLDDEFCFGFRIFRIRFAFGVK